MSREPTSRMHREWQYLAKAEPPPQVEKAQPGRPRRIPRIRVENPGRRTPTRAEREAAFSKFAMTTEKLTDEEREIIRGYRISRRDLGMEE